MIPKPGKTELRPLSVGSPRDKIVQKALALILEEIWEKQFLDCSYGYRPNKTLQQALYQIYRNGSTHQ
jgi:retron-type reverse transcriptase